MRILHVIPTIDPKAGGVSQALLTMVFGLKREGIENVIVTLDDPNEPFVNLELCGVFALGPAISKWRFGKNLLPWLKKNIGLYDIVIIHGLWQYHTFAVHSALKALNATDKPKIFVMPHGMLDPWFQNAKGRQLKALRNSLFWTLFENAVINHATGLLFTCETELLLARESFANYKPKSEHVVGLGVDTPPAFTTEIANAFNTISGLKDEKYWLFISRIHEKKGVDLLINAYTTLTSAGALLPKLIIAGPGLETPFGQTIKQIASTDRGIVFVGMLSGQAKWGAFYGCEAFILPSHQENFGIAVVEALACRKPVLISDQVNIWREIESSKAGIIVQDNEKAISEQLMQWFKLPQDEKMTMANNAGLAFQKYFSVEEATKSMKKVLDGC